MLCFSPVSFAFCLPAPFVHVVMLESSSDVWLQHVAPLAAFSGWTYLPNFCRIAVSVSILSNLIRKLFGKGLRFSDNQLLAVASNWTQNKSCLLWPFVLTDALLSADTAHTKTRDSYTQQGSADNSRSTEKIWTRICALASHAAACNRICSFTLWLTIISPVFISILPDLIPKKTLQHFNPKSKLFFLFIFLMLCSSSTFFLSTKCDLKVKPHAARFAVALLFACVRLCDRLLVECGNSGVFRGLVWKASQECILRDLRRHYLEPRGWLARGSQLCLCWGGGLSESAPKYRRSPWDRHIWVNSPVCLFFFFLDFLSSAPLKGLEAVVRIRGEAAGVLLLINSVSSLRNPPPPLKDGLELIKCAHLLFWNTRTEMSTRDFCGIRQCFPHFSLSEL